MDACWTLTIVAKAKAWVAETPGLVDKQTRLQLLLDNHLLFLAKGQFLPWYLQLQYLMAFKNIPSRKYMFASWILEIGKFHPTHPSNRKLSQWQNKKSLKFAHHINQKWSHSSSTSNYLYQLQLSFRGERGCGCTLRPRISPSSFVISSLDFKVSATCCAFNSSSWVFRGVLFLHIFVHNLSNFYGFGIEFSWLAQETLQPKHVVTSTNEPITNMEGGG